MQTRDGALAPALCERMIATCDQLADRQQRNAAGVRPGLDDSAWTALDLSRSADAAFSQFIEDQILGHFEQYKARVGLSLPISPVRKPSPLIMKRYAASGDRYTISCYALY